MSGKPAARLGDPPPAPSPAMAHPPSTPDPLTFNSTTSPLPAWETLPAAASPYPVPFLPHVLINGKNAAMLGSTLSHGGVVTGGSADVVIG